MSRSPKFTTCCYILGETNARCNKPTRYKMVRDDDQNWVRKYSPWCPEHEAAAKKHMDEELERGEA